MDLAATPSPHFSVDRIDHVVVNCRDVEITADWYVRVLGVRRETFGEGRVALRFGGQKLNLRPTGAPNWVTAAVDRPGSLDLCFIADARADAIGAHLRECGVEITEGPVTKTGALGEMTSHYCRDPDGNLVEVATYLPAD
jgi:catechol 2,3-dioxygenase-like lactoylglutathione lyase family enzyme